MTVKFHTSVLFLEDDPASFDAIKPELSGESLFILPEKFDDMSIAIQKGKAATKDYIFRLVQDNYTSLRCIICDFRLSGENRDFLKADDIIGYIRNDLIIKNCPDFTKYIPVIIYSDYAKDRDIKSTIIAGGDFILSKGKNANVAQIVHRQIARFEKLCQFILKKPRIEVKPKIFIGSSSSEKGLGYANAMKKYFDDNKKCDAHIWTSEFKANEITLHSLETILENFQYSIFIFSPDDTTFDRENSEKKAPRDNVIFEYGLFYGKYTREKTFLVLPQDSASFELKIMSDIEGLNPHYYTDSDDKVNAVTTACNDIINAIMQQNL